MTDLCRLSWSNVSTRVGEGFVAMRSKHLACGCSRFSLSNDCNAVVERLSSPYGPRPQDAKQVKLIIKNMDAVLLLTTGSFLLTVQLFYLQFCFLASLLTVGAKQRSSTVSKKTPTASKQASPHQKTSLQVRPGGHVAIKQANFKELSSQVCRKVIRQ